MEPMNPTDGMTVSWRPSGEEGSNWIKKYIIKGQNVDLLKKIDLFINTAPCVSRFGAFEKYALGELD
jgi:hypothetical protein